MAYKVALCAVAALMSFALTGWFRRAALRRNIVDIPNGRSSHTTPTPRGGGLAFIVAFAAALTMDAALGGVLSTQSLRLSLAVLAPLVLLGWLDDTRGLSATVRLPVHIAVAALACIALGPMPLPLLPQEGIWNAGAWAVSILAVTALINFYNFMDGMDALVAGTSAVFFTFCAVSMNQPAWILLAAAVVGFLPWNLPPAKIFMGDAASTFLGGSVALALLHAPSTHATAGMIAVTLPITLDAAYTICRRLLRRENIFHAHRSHVYQRLHSDAGWSHGRVSLAYAVGSIAAAFAVTIWPKFGPLWCLGGAALLIALAEARIRAQKLKIR